MEIFVFIFENSSTKDILGRIKEIRIFCNCRWIFDFYSQGLVNCILKMSVCLPNTVSNNPNFAYFNKLVRKQEGTGKVLRMRETKTKYFSRNQAVNVQIIIKVPCEIHGLSQHTGETHRTIITF